MTITFLPDLEIFKESIEFDSDTLAHRFKELAYLNAGIRISFTDYRLNAGSTNKPRVEHYHSEGGIRDYLADINADRQPLHQEIIYVQSEKDRVRVEAALQWCNDNNQDCALGFANTIRTIDGGKHLDGYKVAVTRTINSIARQRNKLQAEDPNLGGEHIRDGLTGILCVLLLYSEWEGPTRTRLSNPEVRGIVDSIVSEALTEYLESHPDVADAIIDRAIQASNAADRNKAERELRRKPKPEPTPSPSVRVASAFAEEGSKK